MVQAILANLAQMGKHFLTRLLNPIMLEQYLFGKKPEQ